MHTETELGIILEQRVSPCRTLSLLVGAVWSRRCRCRVDRGTTRSICHHHTLTKELRNCLDIWSLATTCTCARELKQWLHKLRIFNGLFAVDILVTNGVVHIVPLLHLAHLRCERLHFESLFLWRRADINTVATTGTVERRYLNTEFILLGVSDTLLKGCSLRCSCCLLLSCEEWTNSCVRADISTLVTLDTLINIPLRNIHSDTTLLPSGSTIIPSTVLTTIECRNREQVALQSVDWVYYIANELRTRHINRCVSLLNNKRCPLGRYLYLLNCGSTCIDSGVVHIDDILALLAVRFVDSLLHLLDSLLEWDNIRNLEECRLHNGICAATQTQLGCNLGSVDDVEVDIVLCKEYLHVGWQRCASSLCIEYRVEQERATSLQTLQNIVLINIRWNMASDKVRGCYQIWRSDWLVTETKVRRGVTSRLLRVVREVCLTILVGRATDNLNRVLVGTNCSISTQTEEQRLKSTLLCHRNLFANRQREIRNIIYDTNGKVILWSRKCHIGKYCQHLCRGGILR